jgi:large subunit ribosomal protein L13
MKTYVTKPAEVERKWFVVDADGKVLGRLAAEVAAILRGKKKPVYQPNVDAGDYVIIVNADKVKLTGFKEEKKEYFIASRWVGHSRHVSYKSIKDKHPERIVEQAVKGMLPHNPLGRKMFRKLHVYSGPNHKHEAQQPELLEV